ncbi:unnamed protein product, partial [Caenorhabditis auriculariae]
MPLLLMVTRTTKRSFFYQRIMKLHICKTAKNFLRRVGANPRPAHWEEAPYTIRPFVLLPVSDGWRA